MNAVLIFNKPKSITSQNAVTEVRRILKIKKAGHSGTLDPMATGVLLVCLNEATKITSMLMDLEKEYVFKARFGVVTDSYDAEGKITRVVEKFDLNRRDIEKIIEKYIGEITQIPPMYSAVKVNGSPLHKFARKGVEVERKPKRIFIKSITVETFQPPFVTFRVICGKGTYVRSLCYDIGIDVGVGAHIVELVRTRIGEFKIENSINLEQLRLFCSSEHSRNSSHFLKSILTIDEALYFLPSLTIQDASASKFLNGNFIKITGDILPAGYVKIKDKIGRILGIGLSNGIIIKPERIIREANQ